MTQFVHLTDAKRIPSLIRNGIRAAPVRGMDLRECYCTPVSRSQYRTHQWLRELKRRGMRTLQAVQFYVPSDEPVWIGRYNEEHIEVRASEALGIFRDHVTGLGLEICRAACDQAPGDSPRLHAAPSHRLAVPPGREGKAAVLPLKVLQSGRDQQLALGR